MGILLTARQALTRTGSNSTCVEHFIESVSANLLGCSIGSSAVLGSAFEISDTTMMMADGILELGAGHTNNPSRLCRTINALASKTRIPQRVGRFTMASLQCRSRL